MKRHINMIVVLAGAAMFVTGFPLLSWTRNSPWALAYLIAGWAMGSVGSLVGLWRIGEERHQEWLRRKR